MKELNRATDRQSVLSDLEYETQNAEFAQTVVVLTVESGVVQGKNDFGFSVNFAQAVMGIIKKNKNQDDLENRIAATAKYYNDIFGVGETELKEAFETTIAAALDKFPAEIVS